MKYFKVHDEDYCTKHFVLDKLDGDDFWIDEANYNQWYEELQLEQKHCEMIDSIYSDKFSSEQYYGSSKTMFEKWQCSMVVAVEEDEHTTIEQALKYKHIGLWMVTEIDQDTYNTEKDNICI